MKIEIKHWLAGSVLFEGDFESLSAALVAAVKKFTDLRGANLYGANLVRANLDGANLYGANLVRANLYGANLVRANLVRANLDGANLYGANLDGGAAVLARVRDDFWAVLSSAPCEVAGLRKALVEGRVNGSTYTGSCACLVGTIANVQGKHHAELDFLKPDAGRLAECWFLGISEGDTPETNRASKLALLWLDQWVANVSRAFGPAKTAETKEVPL